MGNREVEGHLEVQTSSARRRRVGYPHPPVELGDRAATIDCLTIERPSNEELDRRESRVHKAITDGARRGQATLRPMGDTKASSTSGGET